MSLFAGSLIPDEVEFPKAKSTTENQSQNDELSSVFYLIPIPKTTNYPFINLSGTKPMDSYIYLNKKGINQDPNSVYWNYLLFLSPGENTIILESVNNEGYITGKIESKINYHPKTYILSPILNILKERIPSDLVKKIEIFFKTEGESDRPLGLIPDLSIEEEYFLKSVIKNNKYSYINIPLENELEIFLSHEDRGDVLNQIAVGPIISSPTHPKQNKWSGRNDVIIQWEKVDEAQSYLFSIAKIPSEPESELPHEVTEWITPKIDDGIWYFSLKARTKYGFTSIGTYRLLIDTTPPSIISVTPMDPYQSYKNGSLITFQLTYSDNLFSNSSNNDMLSGIPSAYIEDDDLKNIKSKTHLLPDFSRIIDVDFSSIDSNFSKDRLMFNYLKPKNNGVVEAEISYRISENNNKGDIRSASILFSVNDYAGNKAYATGTISLQNNISNIKLINFEDINRILTEDINNQGVSLVGMADPNTTINLIIFPNESPKALISTDDKGYWYYKIKESLNPGNYMIYANVDEQRLETDANIVQIASFSIVSTAQKIELEELGKPVSTLTPISLDISLTPPSTLGLPLPIKIALIIYGLSFACLIAALVIWYRENPPI